MSEVEGQVGMFDLDGQSTKTYPVHSVQTKEKTSKPSLQNSSALSSRKPPMFLYLNRGGGQTSDFSWEKDGASAGEYMTRNIGVFPSAAKESRLSQILEEDVPEKYRLSPKACRGILNRAARRGKELPKELKTALEAQANTAGGVPVTPTACKETELTEQITPDATEKDGERTKATPLTQSTDRPCANAETLGTVNPNGSTAETELGMDFQATNPADRAVMESLPVTLKLRHTGSPNIGGGGGAGPLMQIDKSATLAVNQDQTLFQPISYGLTSKGNGDTFLSQERHTSLSSGGGMPGQGYAAALVKEPIAVDLYNHTIQGDITATITAHTGASSNGDGSMVMEKNAIGIDHVLISGGTTFQGRGWYDEKSGCLKTQAHGVMINEQKNDDSE